MTSKELKRVLIMAGGTGGHVFPGLALANYLRNQGVQVEWLGTNQGLEAKLVPAANIPLHRITISGLRGKGWSSLFLAPLKITKAIAQSWGIIKTFNPDLVIGMGGFVSGPGGVASWLTNVPLIIHEQNAKAGMTNKILAKLAQKTLSGFPNAFNRTTKAQTVGNPVRTELLQLKTPNERLSETHSPLRLLVIGGSLGAQVFNHLVPHALAKLPLTERPLVRHQTGEKHYAVAKENYAALGVQVELLPFIDDMAQAYNWADVVLCRAGALTVAELCAVGLGAIFVPYPHAVDDHQTANAQFMVKNQAAICIQQADLTEAKLATLLSDFAKSPEQVKTMANAAYALRQTNVVEKIVGICKEVSL